MNSNVTGTGAVVKNKALSFSPTNIEHAQRTMLNKCYEVDIIKFLIRNTFDRLDNKLLQLISPASFIGSNVAVNDGVGGR